MCSPPTTPDLQRDLVSYGLIPEFIGRIPIISSLGALSEEELMQASPAAAA